MHKKCDMTGSEVDDIDEKERSREDTLDNASTLDSRMNGSIANGTVRTIPKPVDKIDEDSSNGKDSSTSALRIATSPFGDASTNFSPQQNHLGFQRVPDECPVLNNHVSGNNMDNNLEHAKSSVPPSASKANGDKFAVLQHRNYNFTPLHVECDPVIISLACTL